MCLHVPVGVGILGVVLGDTGGFNLLESPLWQVDVTGTQIASQRCVLESERSGQGPDLASVIAGHIPDNFHSPVVLVITDSGVSVTRDLLVALGDWGRDIVGVEVAAGLGVDQSKDVAVSNKLERGLGVELWLLAVRVEPPLVVGIFVMITGDLLLGRAFGVCLDVRMEQSSTITHVLDGCSGSIRDFKGAILSDLGTSQVCLE